MSSLWNPSCPKLTGDEDDPVVRMSARALWLDDLAVQSTHKGLGWVWDNKLPMAYGESHGSLKQQHPPLDEPEPTLSDFTKGLPPLSDFDEIAKREKEAREAKRAADALSDDGIEESTQPPIGTILPDEADYEVFDIPDPEEAGKVARRIEKAAMRARAKKLKLKASELRMYSFLSELRIKYHAAACNLNNAIRDRDQRKADADRCFDQCYMMMREGTEPGTTARRAVDSATGATPHARLIDGLNRVLDRCGGSEVEQMEALVSSFRSFASARKSSKAWIANARNSYDEMKRVARTSTVSLPLNASINKWTREYMDNHVLQQQVILPWEAAIAAHTVADTDAIFESKWSSMDLILRNHPEYDTQFTGKDPSADSKAKGSPEIAANAAQTGRTKGAAESEGECWDCGRKGHRSKDCHAKACIHGHSFDDTTCKKHSHYKLHCSDNKKKSGGGSRNGKRKGKGGGAQSSNKRPKDESAGNTTAAANMAALTSAIKAQSEMIGEFMKHSAAKKDE